MTNNLAIESVFKKEKGGLFNFIRKNVLSKEDAEDILNDVFLRLIENIPEIEIVENLTSWLFTVARNKITDNYLIDLKSIFQLGGDAKVSLFIRYKHFNKSTIKPFNKNSP